MSEFISSPHNPIVKLVASLRLKKRRDETGLFIAEGIRLVEEALGSCWKAHMLIYTSDIKETQRFQDLLTKLDPRDCRIIEVPTNIFERISETEQPQGVMLLIDKRSSNKLEQLIDHERPLIAILDAVQDPGNVGTLIRTADAVGCTAVILTRGCADLFSGKTVRASMGSIFHLPVYPDMSPVEIVEFMERHKIKLLATSLESSDNYCSADFTDRVAIIFGNEGNGVSKDLLEHSYKRLHIPIIGKAESLNVSAAAAVILYEAVRQRGWLACN
ncbi:MAG: RNA methyltransferase [Veillonellaceae bacterium]|nr:RNA methyltransferase [Veillonellaceae bacterium]